MSGFFQKLFKRTKTEPPSNGAGIATASALESGEDVEREYQEFCETFCFCPNVRLMDYLAEQKMDRLRDWFHPSTKEPEPKSFVKLVNGATRENIAVWKQTGVQMYLHGRWDIGGGPSQESRDYLVLLAQVLGIPITVYFAATEGGETLSLTFDP